MQTEFAQVYVLYKPYLVCFVYSDVATSPLSSLSSGFSSSSILPQQAAELVVPSNHLELSRYKSDSFDSEEFSVLFKTKRQYILEEATSDMVQ